MKKLFLLSIVCVGMCAFTAPKAKVSSLNSKPVDKDFPSLLPNKPVGKTIAYQFVDSIYNRINLQNYGLDKAVFYSAYKGYEYLLSKGMLENPGLITIVDYSQSSTQKRFYVIDLEKNEVLFNTYVSHGKRSGGEYATSFSNIEGSHKSSLGFMITDNSYHGRAGLSLRLNGVEKGFNSNVRERAIVIHGSHYVNEHRAEEDIVGRSFGCPAVPYGQQYSIIKKIKGGSCVFIWAPNNHYKLTSRIMNATFQWPALKNKSITAAKLLPLKNSFTKFDKKALTEHHTNG